MTEPKLTKHEQGLLKCTKYGPVIKHHKFSFHSNLRIE